MKRILSFIAVALFAGSFLTANAGIRCGEEWKEKIRSEKIAFLTMEMNITPEEAQLFWPVYNQVELAKDAALEELINTYKALNAAIENGNNVEDCLNAYLKAQETLRNVENEAAEQYKTVLPVEKLAKLYIGEEKFRRQHIRNLHNKGEKK